ncbi:MAG: hypothetical protein M3Z31_08820 [Pseudomonadota bacterium]|nr:hypothetical protein [Pseudomonadota bacterium]
MEPTYPGAARRLGRVLELSSEAVKEVAAVARGKRPRRAETRELAIEFSRAVASHGKTSSTHR